MRSKTKVKLSDIVEIEHGYAYKGKHITKSETSEILVTPGNFKIGGGFKEEKLKYYEGPIQEDYILEENDLVVTMTDLSKKADTLGYSALIPENANKRYHHNQRIGLVEIKKPDLVNKFFLYFLMRSPKYRHHVVSRASGSTVKHTSPSRIGSYEFFLPRIEEQEKIADILLGIENKIYLNKDICHTLESTAKALFKSWFVDFEPVSAKKSAIQEGYDPKIAAMAVISGISLDQDWEDIERDLDEMLSETDEAKCERLKKTAALFPDEFKESELGEIPQGWYIKSLDEVADYLNGRAMQKYPPKEGEETLPVLKITELRKGDTSDADIASADIPERFKVYNGDVIFSWSGSLLVDLWCGGDAALNQHLFKVTSEDYEKWFYYLWTKHHLDKFIRIAEAKAVTMGHIKRSHLEEAKCVIPHDDLLNLGNTIIQPFIDKVIQLRLESKNLEELRDTLLPKLISGEIEV